MLSYELPIRKSTSRSNKPMTQWCVDHIEQFFDPDPDRLTWNDYQTSGLSVCSTVNEDGSERYLSIDMYSTNLLRIEMLRSPSGKEICDYIEVGISQKAWPTDPDTRPRLYSAQGWPNPTIVERINGILDCLEQNGLISRIRLRKVYDCNNSYDGYYAITDSEGLTEVKMGKGGAIAIAIEPESCEDSAESFVYSQIFPEPEDQDEFWRMADKAEKSYSKYKRDVPPIIRKDMQFNRTN